LTPPPPASTATAVAAYKRPRGASPGAPSTTKSRNRHPSPPILVSSAATIPIAAKLRPPPWRVLPELPLTEVSRLNGSPEPRDAFPLPIARHHASGTPAELHRRPLPPATAARSPWTATGRAAAGSRSPAPPSLVSPSPRPSPRPRAAGRAPPTPWAASPVSSVEGGGRRGQICPKPPPFPLIWLRVPPN